MSHEIKKMLSSKAPVREWVKPELKRINAGSAEFEQTNGDDNFAANS